MRGPESGGEPPSGSSAPESWVGSPESTPAGASSGTPESVPAGSHVHAPKVRSDRHVCAPIRPLVHAHATLAPGMHPDGSSLPHPSVATSTPVSTTGAIHLPMGRMIGREAGGWNRGSVLAGDG